VDISTVDLCNGDLERVSYTLMATLFTFGCFRLKVHRQVIPLSVCVCVCVCVCVGGGGVQTSLRTIGKYTII
jgi:hypothetical protein